MAIKRILKINNSWTELFNFQSSFNCHWRLIVNEQFLHFPQCFQLKQTILSPFVHIFDIISLFAVELEEPKIRISGKGLK